VHVTRYIPHNDVSSMYVFIVDGDAVVRVYVCTYVISMNVYPYVYIFVLGTVCAATINLLIHLCIYSLCTHEHM
jgi:hypothetical protein